MIRRSGPVDLTATWNMHAAAEGWHADPRCGTRSVDVALQEGGRLSSVLLLDGQSVLEHGDVQTLTTSNHVQAVDHIVTRVYISIIYVHDKDTSESACPLIIHKHRLSLFHAGWDS